MTFFCVQTRIITQESHSSTALLSVTVSVWYLRGTESDIQPEEPIAQYYTSGQKCLSSFLNNSCPEAGGLRSTVVLSLLVSLIHSYWIFHDGSLCKVGLWLPTTHILSWQSQAFSLSSQAMALQLVTQALSQVLIQIPFIPITPKYFSCNLHWESFTLSTLLYFGLDLPQLEYWILESSPLRNYQTICMYNCFFVFLFQTGFLSKWPW